MAADVPSFNHIYHAQILPFCPIYKHLTSIIGLNRSFEIIAGKMTHRNERSKKTKKITKIRNLCSNGQLACPSLHAHGYAAACAHSVACARVVAHTRACGRAHPLYPTKSEKAEYVV
jgi:hypothetical protein